MDERDKIEDGGVEGRESSIYTVMHLLFMISIPLKFVLLYQVFRHGDRSPVGTYPTDKYTESDWPQGYGQLSLVRLTHKHTTG